MKYKKEIEFLKKSNQLDDDRYIIPALRSVP